MPPFARFLPVLAWGPGLDRPTVQADLAAGMTVATMLVPQAMAYALLAGLPPQVGLYSATVPLLVYALLGTSRQLAVGPVAISSLLTAAGLAPLFVEGTADYLAAAALLALMVGAIRIALGLGRLGFLVNFLGHAVLVGFTAAAALIIGFSQARHLFGIELGRADGFVATVVEVVRHLPESDPVTIALSAGSVATLFLLRRHAPRLPAALVVVVVAIVLSELFDLESRGVSVVGSIPASLPGFSVPGFETSTVIGLADTAFVIAIVGFMESIAVAKVFARRNRYEVDPNAELVGLGAANVAAGLFGGYPVNGGLSRTAVNASAGARTPLASVFTAGLVLLTLAFLTPLFTSLPNAALAAIIVMAIVSLIDVGEMRHIARVKPSDLVGLVTAFAGTLLIGVELGIAIGVAASLSVVAGRRLRARSAATSRNVAPAQESDVIHLTGALSFINAGRTKQKLLEPLGEEKGATPASARRPLVVDASGVTGIDATAAAMLGEVFHECERRDVPVHLVAVREPVRQVLERADLCTRYLDHHPNHPERTTR